MQLIVNSLYTPNWQADAVLAYVRHFIGDGIEASWNNSNYDAEPIIAPWYNGRERSYVISMKSKNWKDQINIAFFEYRNSEEICILEFRASTINPPTINDLPADHPYNNSKSALTAIYPFGEAAKAGEKIAVMLNEFWKATL